MSLLYIGVDAKSSRDTTPRREPPHTHPNPLRLHHTPRRPMRPMRTRTPTPPPRTWTHKRQQEHPTRSHHGPVPQRSSARPMHSPVRAEHDRYQKVPNRPVVRVYVRPSRAAAMYNCDLSGVRERVPVLVRLQPAPKIGHRLVERPVHDIPFPPIPGTRDDDPLRSHGSHQPWTNAPCMPQEANTPASESPYATSTDGAPPFHFPGRPFA